jgi:phage terminase Nu1 subunit (DNA packaging protein)
MSAKKREKDEPVFEKELVGTEEIARLTGMTEQWIRRLSLDGIITAEKTKGERGRRFDKFPTLRKIVRYYREKAEQNYNPAAKETADEKLRLMAAKRKLEELKLAQLDGELHKAEDIERVMGALLTRLRINLLAIPMGLAPILRDMDDTLEIAEKLDERIRRAMNEVVDLDLDKLMENEKEEYSEQE